MILALLREGMGEEMRVKKKVLMVGPLPPTVGGITSVIDVILNSPLKEQYDFVPFSTSRPTVGVQKDATDYSLLLKVGPKNLAKSVSVTLCHMASYPIVLLTKKPNIIHIHTTDYFNFFESAGYVLVARLFPKRMILHLHATQFEAFYYNSNSFLRFFIRKTLSVPDQLIVLSSNAQCFFQKICPSQEITVLTNSTSIPEASVEKTDSDVVKVLFVGSEEAKRKGLFDVIKAIPLIVEKCNTKILFLFVGIYDGEKLQAINEAGKQFHCVSCLGFLEKNEMLRVRLASDIYTLPSYAEGLPVALLEAMAAGLPVVTTDVGSIPEVVENGVNGFLIKPGDFVLLAERIAKLANDAELRRAMGRRNVEKIKRLFSSEHIMVELNGIYRDVICNG